MIENLFKKTLVVTDHSKTLLQHFHEHGIDWMHACGAKGRCTTCKVIIVDGADNLQDLTGPEKKYLTDGALRPSERLSCQARPSGDIRILAPKEYQLPHMRYSETD